MIHLSEVRRVPVHALTTYPGNPRTGNVAAIAESLTVHGQYRPVIVQDATSLILCGNHTYLAAVSLGWTEIDAVFAAVDDEQARKLVLVDNRTSDLAAYSSDDLAALLTSVDSLEGTGYSADDLARLVAPLPEGFPALDPDQPGPKPKTVECPECGHEFIP
jgi:ParB-like chromosome segregation protein Spo0J